MNWLQRISGIVGGDGAAARAVIVRTGGPTPRAEGAAMLVWDSGTEGKIGRSEVEARVVDEARALMAQVAGGRQSSARWLRKTMRLPTGEVLGERTGGTVEVLVEAFGAAEAAYLIPFGADGSAAVAIGRSSRSGVAPALLDPAGVAGEPWGDGLAVLAREPLRTIVCMRSKVGEDIIIERIEPRRPPFDVYGTGLVARALVKVLANLPFAVVWHDSAPGHFPAVVPAGVTTIVDADLAQAARAARRNGFHAVMTAGHDLDLAVCRSLLVTGHARFIGVIGSRLKRQRMVARLGAEGFGQTDLDRIVCPIGLPQLRSKLPEVVAVGIAAQTLAVLAGTEDREPRTAQALLAGTKR